MTFRLAIKFRTTRRYFGLHPAGPLISSEGFGQHLTGWLGSAAKLTQVEETLQHAVIEYDLGGDGQFSSHQSLAARVEWAAAQLALEAFEVEVERLIQIGAYTAILGALSGLGLTAKSDPGLALFATLGAGIAGYFAGKHMPQTQKILRATRHPLYGWIWAQYDTPPQLGWSAAT